jgi:hypothetical protein
MFFLTLYPFGLYVTTLPPPHPTPGRILFFTPFTPYFSSVSISFHHILYLSLFHFFLQNDITIRTTGGERWVRGVMYIYRTVYRYNTLATILPILENIQNIMWKIKRMARLEANHWKDSALDPTAPLHIPEQNRRGTGNFCPIKKQKTAKRTGLLAYKTELQTWTQGGTYLKFDVGKRNLSLIFGYDRSGIVDGVAGESEHWHIQGLNKAKSIR